MRNRDVENLVLALLAVGGYRLERAYAKLEGLRREGLLNPSVAAGLDERSAFLRLMKAGYDRGPVVTTMMAARLLAVHAAVRDGTFDRVVELASQGRLDEAQFIAVRVPGVGPRVFNSFVLLHESADKERPSKH